MDTRFPQAGAASKERKKESREYNVLRTIDAKVWHKKDLGNKRSPLGMLTDGALIKVDIVSGAFSNRIKARPKETDIDKAS
jgi:hypothetical protein